ncbi:MAG: DUF554 domain-containing protein [Alicyclobacillus sp.]|nr:DUF554 domain-containing protein [Alicyclobacillus sp.]
MFLLGTLVNGLAVLVGSVLGMVLPRIPDRFHHTIMQGIGLTVILIGLSMALGDSADILIMIVSMALGGLLGSWLDIERKLDQVGVWAERRFHRVAPGKTAEGFVTASLIFCVGSMSIVGAIQSGLGAGNHTLFAKSELDFVTSTVLASTFGPGVLLALVPVVVYEGFIALFAHLVGAHLQNEAVIGCLTATGGLLIMGIGINILGFKKVPVGNLLPAMFIAAFIKWGFPHISAWLPVVGH